MRKLLLVLSTLTLSASVSVAAPPVDLAVTPVEFALLASSHCSHWGPFGASQDVPFSSPGGPSGNVRMSVLPIPNGARADVDGFGSGPAGTLPVVFQMEVDVPIPDVGDAQTPLYASIDHFDHLGAQWRLARATLALGRIAASCVATEASATSGFLGAIGAAPGTTVASGFKHFASYANLASMASPVAASEPQSFIAGDTVRLPLLLTLELQFTGGADSFADSLWIYFKTAPPTIGTGDLNGDRQVDIVDSTLLRRRLAGLPN